MNSNLIFKNVFLFSKVVSKQRASYSANNNLQKECGFGSVRSHAGIGG